MGRKKGGQRGGNRGGRIEIGTGVRFHSQIVRIYIVRKYSLEIVDRIFSTNSKQLNGSRYG